MRGFGRDSRYANAGDSAAMLSDVARSVTRAVRAPVTDDEAVVWAGTGTTPAAEEAYLQGRLRAWVWKGGRKLRRFAVDSSARSRPIRAMPLLTLRPHLAYVKLAGFGGSFACRGADCSARAAIRKAFDTGEDIAEAHAAEAALRFLYDWDWEGAEKELLRSIDLNPSFMLARDLVWAASGSSKRFDEMLSLSEDSLGWIPSRWTRSSITACCCVLQAGLCRGRAGKPTRAEHEAW